MHHPLTHYHLWRLLSFAAGLKQIRTVSVSGAWYDPSYLSGLDFRELHHITHNLQEFNLDIGQSSREDLPGFHAFLAAVLNLKTPVIHGCSFGFDIAHLFRSSQIRLPKLESLRIDAVSLHVQSFPIILRAHPGLLHPTLDCCNEGTDETLRRNPNYTKVEHAGWPEVVDEMSRLKLDSFQIHRIPRPHATHISDA